MHIGDYHAVAAAGKIIAYAFYIGLFAAEIYVHHAAAGAGQLIHKPAGLAEINIFRILRYFPHDLRGYGAGIIKMGKHGADKHLYGGGGGKPRAAQHIAAYIGVKAADVKPQLLKARGYAPYERRGGALFGVYRLKTGQIRLKAAVKALRYHAHAHIVRGQCCGNGIKAYARRHNAAAVVVSVVAYDLAAPGGGKKCGGAGKKAGKGFCNAVIPPACRRYIRIQRAESFVLFGAADKVGKVGFHMLLR